MGFANKIIFVGNENHSTLFYVSGLNFESDARSQSRLWPLAQSPASLSSAESSLAKLQVQTQLNLIVWSSSVSEWIKSPIWNVNFFWKVKKEKVQRIVIFRFWPQRTHFGHRAFKRSNQVIYILNLTIKRKRTKLFSSI